MGHRAQQAQAPRATGLWLALFALVLVVVSFGAPRPPPGRTGERAAAADQGRRVGGLERAPRQLEASGLIDSDTGSEDDSDDSHPFGGAWHRTRITHAPAVTPAESRELGEPVTDRAWVSANGRGTRSSRGPPRA